MFLCAEFLVPTHQGRRLPGSPAVGLQGEQEGRGAHSLALQVAEGRDVSCPEKPGAGGTIRCPQKRVQSGILTRAGLVVVLSCGSQEAPHRPRGWREVHVLGACLSSQRLQRPSSGEETGNGGTSHVPPPVCVTGRGRPGRKSWRPAGGAGPDGAIGGAWAHLRKGASRLMLCQKVDGFRLGSASTRTCCCGKLVGRAGCFWRVR